MTNGAEFAMFWRATEAAANAATGGNAFTNYVGVWHLKQLPAYGVYPCFMETGDTVYRAVVNIGLQPTMPSGKVTVEAHALEDSPELYGQAVRLTLGPRIRAERKFASPAELAEQIGKDREDALKWFGMA